MKDMDIDAALVPITRELQHWADEILDLREAAVRRLDPGRCISCYFKLLAGSRPGDKPVTTPLRLWLEQHLEVVARDSGQRELERLPVHLETEDIEAYCQQVMADFRYDRDYAHLPTIELAFQFKETDNASHAA
jgi:hypothetical protein